MPMIQTFIALGSNLGDRLGQMQLALEELSAVEALQIVQASPLYENRAIGMAEGADDFLNAVVEVRTSLEPLALLELCLSVEDRLGRVRGEGWIPRTIDLDLVAYADSVVDTERLQLPHPRIAERDFVLHPLFQIAPSLMIAGQSVEAMHSKLSLGDLRAYDGVLWPVIRG